MSEAIVVAGVVVVWLGCGAVAYARALYFSYFEIDETGQTIEEYMAGYGMSRRSAFVIALFLGPCALVAAAQIDRPYGLRFW